MRTAGDIGRRSRPPAPKPPTARNLRPSGRSARVLPLSDFERRDTPMADENENNVTVTKRGFAAMDPEKRREIARKGGAAVSQNKEHMAEIGRKGGEAR